MGACGRAPDRCRRSARASGYATPAVVSSDLEPQAAQEASGDSVGRAVDLPAENPLAVGGWAFRGGLDVAEVPGAPVELAAEALAAVGHRVEAIPMNTYYAEAFTVFPGRCFRMVTDPELRRRGQPTHCKAPVVWRGRFRTRGECIFRVDACADHGGELSNRTKIRTPSGRDRRSGLRW